MITLLKKNPDRTYDLVSHSEVKSGDEFQIGYNAETKQAIMKTINNIIEQRKERGTYKDESKRRFWAKIQ